MSKPYIIVYDINNEGEKNIFVEIIRSTFISKQGNEHTILISAPRNTRSKALYEKIRDKLDRNLPFFVIEMDNFYGNLYVGSWEWLEETFPNLSFTKTNQIKESNTNETLSQE